MWLPHQRHLKVTDSYEESYLEIKEYFERDPDTVTTEAFYKVIKTLTD